MKGRRVVIIANNEYCEQGLSGMIRVRTFFTINFNRAASCQYQVYVASAKTGYRGLQNYAWAQLCTAARLFKIGVVD
jgi:hypothetical protein